jgi:phage-related baseplate assembly protein
MMLDAVAYVGDQLSFYLDYNVNESFLDTAYQYDNVLRHGRILGYKFQGRASTFGKAALYVLVPASATGIGPDRRYIPTMRRGATFSSNTGLSFVLTENIDFSDPQLPVVTARVDTSTGAPTFYAIKAYGEVVSGFFGRERITIGDYERFKKINITNTNVAEIISVTDSNGNEYYEVDYLAQDMIFKEVSNKDFRNDNVPSILKPFLVSRKFVVERSRTGITLQFGSGDSSQSDVIADPSTVAVQLFGKDYVTDTTFDPSRMTKNQSFGVVPSNTTLDIVYRATNAGNSNLSAGSLNNIASVVLDFDNEQGLDRGTLDTIRSTIEVDNEDPIVGDVSENSTDDIKRKIYDTFPTQNRAVTQADYENLAYRMPAKFGKIKRVSVQKDPNSERRNLNMFVVAEDNFGKLATANTTLKNNLKTWLNSYRMLSDTVDILDAFIFNFGIEFVVTPNSGVDRFDLLRRCSAAITEMFSTPFFIGEQINISDIYSHLSKVTGVLDVVKVKIVNKTGTNYSNVQFNINQNTSPDGTYIMVPKNVIAELKYSTDIVGKIR